jgi:hypothetical protein
MLSLSAQEREICLVEATIRAVTSISLLSNIDRGNGSTDPHVTRSVEVYSL